MAHAEAVTQQQHHQPKELPPLTCLIDEDEEQAVVVHLRLSEFNVAGGGNVAGVLLTYCAPQVRPLHL